MRQFVESIELSISQQKNCSLKEVSLTLHKNWRGTRGKNFCKTQNKDVSKGDNVKWITATSLGDCKDRTKAPIYFDTLKDKIDFNFNLENLTDPSCSEILPKVLTIKFTNGTGSIVYSNSHEMNNWLNPEKGEDYRTAKKLKG